MPTLLLKVSFFSRHDCCYAQSLSRRQPLSLVRYQSSLLLATFKATDILCRTRRSLALSFDRSYSQATASQRPFGLSIAPRII